MSRLAAALVVTAIATFTASPARPCSPPPPGFHAFRPPAEAKIPRNTVVAIQHFQVPEPRASIFEYDFSFPVEPVTHAGLILVPIDGVAGRIPIGVTVEDTQGEVPALYIQYNDVDVAGDFSPPSFAPQIQFSFEWREHNSARCHVEGYHLELVVDIATDDTGIAYYSLIEQSAAGSQLVSARLSNDLTTTSISLYGYLGTTGGRRCFVITAHDWAGNTATHPPEDDPLCINLDQNPSSDAGIAEAGVDAGGRDAGAATIGELRTAEPSCGCRASSNANTGSALLVVLFAIVLRRRVKG